MSDRTRRGADYERPEFAPAPTNGHGAAAPKTAGGGGPDLTPRKTAVILVIVVGCFAVLWPRVFQPMMAGLSQHQVRPNELDKRTGCCDVISDTDVDTISILSALCRSIIDQRDGPPISGPRMVQLCKAEVLRTCGIDISAVLQEQVRLGRNVRQIVSDVRSMNGSLCLKYNYGVSPWTLGVGHRLGAKGGEFPSIRQERPPMVKPEMLHPAFRERGRAIPHPQKDSPARPPSRVLEGRPGPVPGLRPTIGGAGHVVPPSKQGSSMSVIMPIYTIGIVIFFTYTLMKIVFKKQPEGHLYPPVEPSAEFRREVFESDKRRMASSFTRDGTASKLGDIELDHLRQRLSETEKAMERIVAQMTKLPLRAQDGHLTSNGKLSNGSAMKTVGEEEEEPPSVTVLGMETTASCEGGQRWTRPESPVVPHSHSAVLPEPTTPPQEIYLEGALPPQSQLLVSDSAAEPEERGDDPAVVLAGKMTLSVISIDQDDEVSMEVETKPAEIIRDELKVNEKEEELPETTQLLVDLMDDIVTEVKNANTLQESSATGTGTKKEEEELKSNLTEIISGTSKTELDNLENNISSAASSKTAPPAKENDINDIVEEIRKESGIEIEPAVEIRPESRTDLRNQLDDLIAEARESVESRLADPPGRAGVDAFSLLRERTERNVENLLHEANEPVSEDRSDENTLNEVSNIETEAEEVNKTVIREVFEDKLDRAEMESEEEEDVSAEEEVEYELEYDDEEEGGEEEREAVAVNGSLGRMGGSRDANLSSVAVAELNITEDDNTDEEIEVEEEEGEGDEEEEEEEIEYEEEEVEEEEEEEDTGNEVLEIHNQVINNGSSGSASASASASDDHN